MERHQSDGRMHVFPGYSSDGSLSLRLPTPSQDISFPHYPSRVGAILILLILISHYLYWYHFVGPHSKCFTER